MADSEASSGDWEQLLQRSLARPSSSDSTVCTTTAGSITQPQIEGRVAKPHRRRSRASRRVPTTLLNTDTANFRAMVQQFTGIPSAQFPPAYQPNTSYGLGLNEATPFNHLQQQQQFHFQQYPPQQQRVFNLGNSSNDSSDHAFLQGLGLSPNPNPNPRGGMQASEGFFMDGPAESRAGGYLL